MYIEFKLKDGGYHPVCEYAKAECKKRKQEYLTYSQIGFLQLNYTVGVFN